MTTQAEVQGWAGGLAAVLKRIAPRFARAEPRRRAAACLRGLLAPIARKNGWQLAEAAGDAAPDGVQDFLSRAQWDDAEAVRDDLQACVAEHLGDSLLQQSVAATSWSRDRGGGGCLHAQPYVGAGTPELRPHRLTPNGVRATAPGRLICAPRCRFFLEHPHPTPAQAACQRKRVRDAGFSSSRVRPGPYVTGVLQRSTGSAVPAGAGATSRPVLST